jgi:hypothetical protein
VILGVCVGSQGVSAAFYYGPANSTQVAIDAAGANCSAMWCQVAAGS